MGAFDLARDADVAGVVSRLQERWDGLDFVVHAVAHAKRDELEGRLAFFGGFGEVRP